MTEDLSHSAPSLDSHFTERIKRLVRPEGLTTEEEQPWAGGRGTDVWEILTAAIRGDLPTIEKLVREDPRLATCSNQYRTPLHFAVQENHIDVVRFLLDHGADATYRSGNFWHERPTTIAEERGYTDLHAVLQEHLAPTAGIAEPGAGGRIACSMAWRSWLYSSELMKPASRSFSSRRTSSAASISPFGGTLGLAITTGAEGINASRIMLRSAECCETEIARNSSARPIALKRPEICSGDGTGRSSPAAGGGEVSGSKAPMFVRRRPANSPWVINP